MQLKTCHDCKKELPLTEYYMMKSKYKEKTYIFPRHVCKKCNVIYSYKWRIKNKDRYLETIRMRKYKKKIKLLNEMGGKCKCCGCVDFWNLSFDHITPILRKNGTGRTDMMKILIKDKKLRKQFQILCHGCNLSKNTNERCVIDHKLRMSFV